MGPNPLGTEPARRVSAYAVQQNVADAPISLAFSAGAARGEATLRLEPGSFNTLIVTADGAMLRASAGVDQAQFNQVRARLSFYNAMAGCGAAGLALEPDGQAVFNDVAAGTGRMRAVNPVTAQVRVTCGAARSAPFPLSGMEAGGKYSVWLIAPRGQPVGFVTRDATTPWRP